MTILPKRIFPRLVVLLLVVTALSQAFSLQEALEGGHRTHRSLVRSQIFEQVEATLRLLSFTPSVDWRTTLDHLSLADLCYSLTSAPQVAGDNVAADRVAQRLQNLLGPYSSGASRLAILEKPTAACDAYVPVSGIPFNGRPNHHHAFSGLVISVPLADGRWLNANARLVIPSIWESLPILSILSMLAATILVVFWVVSHETRSLRRLASAVEGFGRGQTVADVPETGPSEVVGLIRAFNTMQDRLTRFIQDRTRLLAAISHDLRTPLTSLRLKAELLDNSEVADQMISTIEEMGAIVQSTLDFARTEAKAEANRSVDLTSLVDSLVEDMAELGQSVRFEESPRINVQCRPTAIRRGVRNLIENAIRYGGSALVRCRVTQDFAIVEIDDEGPGIPPESLAEVIKPFVRLEGSRNSATGGVGLGLAIVNDIVAAHGGNLILENKVKGLRATLRIALPQPRP
ncbi:MAG TPA: ATP-binding protein [Candidatus Sulfotelmatobacter sp.]|jgi:signal transduction histidine kinase|nr:ATP-binding protein [Candidatus Sulfotelmatobacter sp.]